MTAQTAASVRIGIAVLRRESFDAVVIDQVLLDADPMSVDVLLRHTRTAIAVFFNPAIQGSERVVREVRSALQRRQHEQTVALQTAVRSLRNELNSDVTGILLSSQLALAVPALPVAAEAKIRSVCELAERMRVRLSAPPESRARPASAERRPLPVEAESPVTA